jgi:3-oxoacyl-[acyl-carrier protein] reductase
VTLEALRGKRVLLTGASRGIGRAVARQLLDAGSRLAVVGRDQAALAHLLGAAGGGGTVLQADLAQPENARGLVAKAVDVLGGLDAIVSSAGIVEYAHVEVVTAEAIERQHAINFTSPLCIALEGAAVLPDGGSIVFVASTLALTPAPLTLGYAASKAALVAATRSLALELAPRGIRVNAVAPGPVATDMLRVVRYAPGEAQLSAGAAQGRVEEQLEALRVLHPLRRLALPEEVAHTVLYLLTAGYVTGNILPVDGGLLLGSGVT